MTGDRRLAERLKTAKGRRPSSIRWLSRQVADPYVGEAKRRGYRGRAAFKLAEIDDRYKLLKPGDCVLDLGAAPGGWSQVAAERVGAGGGRGQGRVVAVDIVPLAAIAGVAALTLDCLAADAAASLRSVLGQPASVVLSDMAPAATGHRETDHLRSLALAEAALGLALQLLAPGGTFLVKLLQGGGEVGFIAEVKRYFATVRRVKPKASRAESAEFYVLASGFRGPEEPRESGGATK